MESESNMKRTKDIKTSQLSQIQQVKSQGYDKFQASVKHDILQKLKQSDSKGMHSKFVKEQ